MLSRKHFVQFAKVLLTVQDREERTRQAKTIIDMCKKENPRFDVNTFLIASGLCDKIGRI